MAIVFAYRLAKLEGTPTQIIINIILICVCMLASIMSAFLEGRESMK
jgi:hypothetical protein